MNARKLDRFIKDKTGEKVAMKTTSINLTESQMDFVKRKNLNLSAMVRELLESCMEDTPDDSSNL